MHDSVFAVDSDHRAVLLQNIVLVGGGSTIPGLADRLNHELSLKIPGSKLKIHAPGNSIERRHSVWLGGSILASLGTFHQLWVGAEEWKEHGPAILAQRESRIGNLLGGLIVPELIDLVRSRRLQVDSQRRSIVLL